MEPRPKISTSEINDWFTYHPPGEVQQVAYLAIRAQARLLALVIRDHCPASADTTAAIRKLREAVMTANAAVAIGGKEA